MMRVSLARKTSMAFMKAEDESWEGMKWILNFPCGMVNKYSLITGKLLLFRTLKLVKSENPEAETLNNASYRLARDK